MTSKINELKERIKKLERVIVSMENKRKYWMMKYKKLEEEKLKDLK